MMFRSYLLSNRWRKLLKRYQEIFSSFPVVQHVGAFAWLLPDDKIATSV